MNITFKGEWVADAGFETGTLLKVRVMPAGAAAGRAGDYEDAEAGL